MTITIEIPDELAGQLIAGGKNMERTTLEALALVGYRDDRLTAGEIRVLLGFDTRMEVDAFLKEHGAFLPYTDEDLAHDIEVAGRIARKAQSERLTGSSDQRIAG